jgi:hypothetical protein
MKPKILCVLNVFMNYEHYEWKKNNQWVLTAHRKETKFNQVI